MKIKTFILTFLLMMSCPFFMFGQSRAGEIQVTDYDGICKAIKLSSESGKLVSIYLKKDIEVSKQISIPEDAKISIDLNDFVLSSPSDVYIFKNLGELTITDNSDYGGGTIESKGIANGSETKVGTLNINGGNFIHNSNAGAIVYNYASGKATINAGTFIGGDDTPAIINKGDMTIDGSESDEDNRVVIRENGSSDKTITCFSGSKLEISNAYIYGANIKENTDCTVTVGDNVMFVKAEVGTMDGDDFTANEVFGSLGAAVVKANEGTEGNVVRLLYNTTESDIVEVKDPITIIGNNKTLTSTAKRAINVNIVGIATEEVVSINNLTIVGEGECERGINIIRDTEVTEPTAPVVNINNVTISDMTHYAVHVARTGDAVKININGSDLSAWGALAVYGDGTVCNVENSKLTGTNTYKGETNAFATIALGEKDVTINVDAISTVTAQSSDEHQTQYIVCKNDATKNAKVVLNTKDLILVGSNVEYFENDFSNIDLQVNAELSSTLEEAGYALGTPTEDGLVSVEGVAVAKINGKNYPSLQAALAAVADDQTIEIIANEGSIGFLNYPIEEDENYATNFSITTKEGFEYVMKGTDKLVFNNVNVTFTNANIRGLIGSSNSTIALSVNNNIKTLQSSNGGVFSVAEGEHTIGTLMGELNVSGEPTLAINAVGNGGRLVINNGTLNGTLPANIDVTVAEGENNVIKAAINGGNFVVAENTAVKVQADMTDLALLTIKGKMDAAANVKVNAAEGNITTINGEFTISGEGIVASFYRSVTVGGKVNVNEGATFTQSNKNYSFNLNNGAEVNVAEGSVITVGAVKVATEAEVALNFNGNASFKSTTNAGTINLYMKEGTTFTTNNIDGEGLVAKTDDNCKIFYKESAYVAERILHEGDVAKIGEVGYKTLQDAIDACTTPGDYTIVLLGNITETPVEIDQTKDINITIDGGEETRYEFSGKMCIHGKSNYTSDETLTIKNINFYNESLTAHHDFISSNNAHDGHERYAHNVTIENCNFSVPAETEYDVVAMRFRQAFNIKVIGGEFKNLHSVMWATGTSGIAVKGINAIGCKEGGISFGTSTHLSVKGSTINVNESDIVASNYGIRVGGNGVEESLGGPITIEKSNITADIPVLVRNANNDSKVTFLGENTITELNSNNDYYCVIGAGEYDGGVNLPEAATGNVIVDLTNSNLSYDGVYGNYYVAKIDETRKQYQSLAEALAAVENEQTIEITALEGSETAAINYNGEGKTFTIKSAEGSMYSFGGNKITLSNANVTLDNANINGIVVASTDANININGDTYVKTIMAAATGKYLVNGATFNIGTLMSDVCVSGESTLKVYAYKSGTLYANGAELNDATSLPAGIKFVFEGENTVTKSSLNGNITFNNGKTTLDAASLAGTINVKEGAEVNFKNNTYLTSVSNGEYVNVAGTLNIDKSGAWVSTIAVTGTGKLNITEHNENDDYYLGGNDLNVRITLTNNGAINVKQGAIVTIGSASTTDKLDGNGTLTIAGAMVDASNVAKENITSQVLLSGNEAKFYAPKDLTNVADAAGLSEPTYFEEGYYSLDGTYVAEIVGNDGKTYYQFRTVKSALASDKFSGEIFLINNTNEAQLKINKDVTFNVRYAEGEEQDVRKFVNNVTLAEAKKLTIAEGANIQFTEFIANGSVINNGTVNIKTNYQINLASSVLTNNGTLEAVKLTNMRGTLTNKGTITAATFVNEKTFTNDSSLTATTLTNSGTITNNGTITTTGAVTNDGTIEIKGTLTAEATEDATFTNNNQISVVGGTLTLNEEYTYSAVNGATVSLRSEGTEQPVVSIANELQNNPAFNVTNAVTLDNNTRLNKANITFANVSANSTINGANLTNSNLTVGYNHTLNVVGELDIAKLTLNYEKEYNKEYFSTVNVGTLNEDGTLKENGTLKVGTLTNKAKLNVNGKLTTAALTNASAAYITNNGELTANSNGIVNNGTLTNKGSLTAATITNSKTISNAAGKSLTVNGKLTNDGTIENGGKLTVTTTANAGQLFNNATLNNSGSLEIDGFITNNGTITNSNSIVNYGKLSNSGTLKNVGTEQKTANITVGGELSNNKGATLDIEYATLTANYNVTNNGTITVKGTLVNTKDTFTNNNIVNVTGTSAVINIANNVDGDGKFYMKNVNLVNDNKTTTDVNEASKLMNANVVFVDGTNLYKNNSEINGATLTNSKLIVNKHNVLTISSIMNDEDDYIAKLDNSYATSTVNVNAALTVNGDITNAGNLNINAKTETGDVNNYATGVITVLNAKLLNRSDQFKLTNNGKLNIEYSGEGTATVKYNTINNYNEINVNGTTLIATNLYSSEVNDIVKVSGKSELSAYCRGDGIFNMTNVELNNQTELENANIEFNGTDNQVTSSTLTDSKVTVNSGAELKLKEGDKISVAELTNKGNIYIGKTQLESTKAENSGVIYLETTDSELIVPNTVATPILGEYLESQEYEGDNIYEVYYENSYKVREYRYVARIGNHRYSTLEGALNAAKGDDVVVLLPVADYPVVMKGEVVGKNVKITTDGKEVKVDWSEGSLFVGRSRTEGVNGDATLTFDNAKLSSISFDEQHAQELNISGKHYDGHASNGTVIVDNSNIEVDYILVRNSMEVYNSTVTIKGKNGYKTPSGNICNVLIGGRPASETGTGDHAVAYLTLNNSTLDVQENIRLGYEGKANVSVSEGSHVESKSVYVDSGSKLTSTGNILASMDEAVPNAIVLDGGVYSQDVNQFCKTDYTAYPCVYNGYEGYWNVRMSTGKQIIQLEGGENGQGWNWISSYISDFNLTDLQEQLGTYATGIVAQAPNMFSQYEAGVWTGLLDNVTPREMYKVQVTENVEITFEGDYVDYGNYTITLYPGYNWIGYPVSVSMMVSDAFVNPVEGDMIYTNGDEFAIFEGGIWDGDFELIPGHGYIYYYTGDSELEFTYPIFVDTDDANNSRTAKENKRWNATTTYANSMRMIAMVSIDGEVVDGNYEVAAFANGELRGSARPVYVESLGSYVVLLNVNGNNAEELTFKYYDVNYGTEYELNNRINFTNNALVGSMDEPYMLNLGILDIDEAATSEISIYPNPTTTNVEINLNATCDTVEVFNTLGVKVAEYSNVDSIDALETAGVYVIRITNDGNVQNCRLVVK